MGIENTTNLINKYIIKNLREKDENKIFLILSDFIKIFYDYLNREDQGKIPNKYLKNFLKIIYIISSPKFQIKYNEFNLSRNFYKALGNYIMKYLELNNNKEIKDEKINLYFCLMFEYLLDTNRFEVNFVLDKNFSNWIFSLKNKFNNIINYSIIARLMKKIFICFEILQKNPLVRINILIIYFPY